MSGKLIWIVVLLLVTGTISAEFVATNDSLKDHAQTYVQTLN